MLMLQVFGEDMDQAAAVAKVIQEVLDARGVIGYAIPGVCLPEILAAWGVTSLPAVTTEDRRILWQGSVPESAAIEGWVASAGPS